MNRKIKTILTTMMSITAFNLYAGDSNLLFAVGSAEKNDRTEFPIVAVASQKGESWDYLSIPLPTDYKKLRLLTAPSCNNNFCVAASSYWDSSNDRKSLFAIRNNQTQTWKYVPIQHEDSFTGVAGVGYEAASSCNDSFCAVAQIYSTKENRRIPMIMTSANGQDWTFSKELLNVPEDYGHYGEVSKLKCTNDLCIAVGGYIDKEHKTFEHVRPLMAVSRNKETWSYVNVPLPEDGIGFATLAGVDCTEKMCVAVGSYEPKSRKGTQSYILISKDKGASWSVNSIVPAQATGDSDFTSVKCHQDMCIAVGCYEVGKPKRYKDVWPLIAVTKDDGKTWTLPSSIISKLSHSVDAVNVFRSIDCNDKMCFAAGEIIDDKAGGFLPLLAFSDSKAESWSYVIDLPEDTSGTLIGDAYCNKNICMATGSYVGTRGGKRTTLPLSIVTQDGGKTWLYPKEVVSKLPLEYETAQFWGSSSHNSVLSKKRHWKQK